MAEVISIRRKSPPQPKLLLRRAREVQRAWAEQPLADRLAVVEAFRGSLASSIDALVGSVGLPQRGGAAETIAICRWPVRPGVHCLQIESPDCLIRTRGDALGSPAPHGVCHMVAGSPSNARTAS